VFLYFPDSILKGLRKPRKASGTAAPAFRSREIPRSKLALILNWFLVY